MLNACILLKTVQTRADKILKVIREFPEVKKAYLCYGRFDVVAFLEVKDYKDLRRLTGQINSVEGVRSTETLVEA